MPDREMEYMAALALNGGTATTRQMETALGRSHRSAAMVRQKLIEQGDIYAPRRGQVRMSMPVFVPYVLARYEEARAESGSAHILSLDQMRAALDAESSPQPYPEAPMLSARQRQDRQVPPHPRSQQRGPQR